LLEEEEVLLEVVEDPAPGGSTAGSTAGGTGSDLEANCDTGELPV
jgi:hypothetical protein